MLFVMKKHTLAIVGCGKLAHIIVDALNQDLLTDYQFIGAYSRTKAKAISIAEKVIGHKAKPCDSIDELLALKPDYIVEMASPDALLEFAIPALKNASSKVTLSIGPMADKDY